MAKILGGEMALSQKTQRYVPCYRPLFYGVIEKLIGVSESCFQRGRFFLQWLVYTVLI